MQSRDDWTGQPVRLKRLCENETMTMEQEPEYSTRKAAMQTWGNRVAGDPCSM